MKISWHQHTISRFLASSLAASLFLISGGDPSYARDKPSKEHWERNVYSQRTALDPKNSSFPLGPEWDIDLLELSMFGYTGTTYVEVITIGGFPLENGRVMEPHYVVFLDTNNNKDADLSLSTKDLSYAPDMPILAQSLHGQDFSNCKFKLRSGWINDYRGDQDTLAIGWQGCKPSKNRPIGVRVELISEGKILDVFPNKGKFVKFDTDYNSAWPCNASKKGKERVNWLRKPQYSSYCSLVGGNWTWTKTKEAGRKPSNNSGPRVSPKP